MNIRIYRSQDKDACIAIFESNCPKYFMDYERAEFIDWLDRTDRLEYFVIEEEEEILACGGVYKDDDLDEVGFAWGMVANSYHGKGLGTKLTLHRIGVLANSFPNHDIKLATSQLTKAFYAKLGFEETAFEKDGWGEGFDKITMYRYKSR